MFFQVFALKGEFTVTNGMPTTLASIDFLVNADNITLSQTTE